MCICSLIYQSAIPALHHLDKFSPHEETSAASLSHCDKDCKFFIPHLFQLTQETSFEEDLK